MNVILTIAGSDPSGGAGIQADIKTITSLGHFAAAVITTITCQNSLGVSLVSPLDPSLVHNQIQSVLEDYTVSHIKIGMTGTTKIIQAICDCLAAYSGEIILDPVLQSSSGSSLLTDTHSALSPLLSLATVLTPNSHELSLLSGLHCTSRKENISAGKQLLKTYPNLQAICLKGGHLHENNNEIKDTLLLRNGETTTISHPRYKTKNSHGTGCTFASAFSSYHAKNNDYKKAFRQTVNYMDMLLQLGQNDQLGKGTGSLAHYRLNTK